MVLKERSWYFKKAIPENFCNSIIKNFSIQKNEQATIGSIADGGLIKKRTRNSLVHWINEKWMYDLIHRFVGLSNQNAGWNFDVNFTEKVQFTKYKLNQHYTWHKDTHCPDNNEPIRKISSVMFLNNPKDYKGGEFQFKLDNEKKQEIVSVKPDAGTVIVFPSFITHRVTPVLSGERYTLVSWTKGPQFK
jgi:PKHD-type hydroxylase